MKKIITLLVVAIIALTSVVTVGAAEGRVNYSGNAGDFIFKPGSEHSPTDLFPNFKGVMPGDTLTQTIAVKNDADNKVKVKIYLRSLGAHEDSVEFLSQLGLRVAKSEENEMAYMFDSAADKTAQLTDWVCLGTLYSGGEVYLDLLLDVPTALDNEFQSKIGYLDWEFKIEEYPIESQDPQIPQTGDNSKIVLWSVLMVAALIVIIILVFSRKRYYDDEE